MNPKSCPKIITHFIAGFPSYEASLEAARGMIDGGAFALEMQIPFSDPSADGPVIEEACQKALNAGFKTADAFRLLETIRSESDIPVFVMSYASLAVTPGVENFVRRAKDTGANGLIIPDLTPGADEGLYQLAADAKCPAVPVILPWISSPRLLEILTEPIDWVYVALRSGITGTYTEIGEEQVSFLTRLKELHAANNIKVMAGFGIQCPEQVHSVMKVADAAIIGSELVKTIATAAKATREAVQDVVEWLRGQQKT